MAADLARDSPESRSWTQRNAGGASTLSICVAAMPGRSSTCVSGSGFHKRTPNAVGCYLHVREFLVEQSEANDEIEADKEAEPLIPVSSIAACSVTTDFSTECRTANA
eukprot:3631572-Rhodomonas_salina.2